MVRTHSTPTPRTARSMGCMVLRFGLTAREEGRSWPPVAAEQLLSTITNTLRCLLNTALAMPEVRPLCQKPPSPMKASAGLEAPRCAPGPQAGAAGPPRPAPPGGAARGGDGGGGRVEGGDDGKQVAADVGRDMVHAQFAFDQFQRGENRPLGAAHAQPGRARRQQRR